MPSLPSKVTYRTMPAEVGDIPSDWWRTHMSDFTLGAVAIVVQIAISATILSVWLWRVWANPFYRRVGIFGAVVLALAYGAFLAALFATRS